MFSSRTEWDLRPSSLYSLLQKERASRTEILDLTESNPTKCGFEYQPSDLLDPASLKRSVFYEPDPKGLRTAREAVAAWYEHAGIAVDPERVVLTSSTSEAYTFLFRLLCNAGDRVAIPKPSYPLFEYLGRLSDLECQPFRLEYDGEWHMNVGSLEDNLKSGAKALVVVHPNNPTGSYIKEQERHQMLSRARRYGVPLIVDEVFHPFALTDDAGRASGFAATDEVLTFAVNGLSKLVGLPQMKLAWIVVSGPTAECEAALHRLEVISDTFLSVNTPAQQALPGLISDPVGMTTRIHARIKANHSLLSNQFSTSSPVTLLRCEGGWNAVLRLPATRSDDDWARELLLTRHVLTHPGSLFDFDMKACLVISLLTETGTLREGARRIALACEE